MALKGVVDVPEQKRLNEAREASIPWKKWGPYLSERQWGTVREDYSDDGNAWNYFSHDQPGRGRIVGAKMASAEYVTTNGSVAMANALASQYPRVENYFTRRFRAICQ